MPELNKLTGDSSPVSTISSTTEATKQTATQAASTAQQATTNVAKQLTHPSVFPKLIIFGLTVILGIGTGYLLNQLLPGKPPTGSIATNIDSSKLKVGEIIGIDDASAFPDDAEGVLEKGGIEGEGSHHLLRPGGESQNVYLTSSVVDLDALVGHKVQVWGETFSAQRAGWLMDVGRVQVLELNASKPE